MCLYRNGLQQPPPEHQRPPNRNTTTAIHTHNPVPKCVSQITLLPFQPQRVRPLLVNNRPRSLHREKNSSHFTNPSRTPHESPIPDLAPWRLYYAVRHQGGPTRRSWPIWCGHAGPKSIPHFATCKFENDWQTDTIKST